MDLVAALAFSVVIVKWL
ncbi:hypothetical protein UM760_10205 [Staphylococcus aureus]|nr:hypothetical protein UM760_10205 [Staphylococcus aureus]